MTLCTCDSSFKGKQLNLRAVKLLAKVAQNR